MTCNKKIICWVCILALLVGFAPLLAKAEGQLDALAETTLPQTLPTETAGAEETVDVTVPEETLAPVQPLPLEEPEETVPAETSPVVAETLPQAPAAPENVSGEANRPAEPDDAIHDYMDVPLYFQTDYPNNMFGTGTIASSGCSITCLAMVATYMTGREYLPDELARYFGGTAENNIRRLEIGSETMQLPFYKAENVHRTLEAVRDGKVAIVMMNERSIFTESQHFIVITGMNEDGLYMVNDPLSDNYAEWDTERGLVDGFTDGDLIRGYSGGWVYDKSAMPEDPFLYYEPEPVRGEPRYPEIELSAEDRRLLARVLWVEARGESLEGQQAVAEVVFNRMVSEDFPNTLRGVIFAENQFRSVPFLDDAKPYQAQYEAIESALYGPYVLDEGVVHFATYAVNDNVWGEIGGHIFCYGA